MIARMLHISDLHFSPDLMEVGRRLKAFRLLPGPNSHSFGKVDGLSLAVRQSKHCAGEIDLTLATGDISTDGSARSLSTACEFLEEPAGIYRGKPKRLKTMGLAADRARRLVVPGNHDRYGGAYGWPASQRPSDDLESIFKIEESYPYSVGFRRANVPNSASYPALLFFVFDSSLADNEETNLLYRIARGKIEPAQCRWLVEESANLAQRGTIGGLDGSELKIAFDRCIKVAVLHHHPVGRRLDVSFGTNTLREAIDLTKMENGDEFIRACFDAGIDFILFGHQHLAYQGWITPRSMRKGKRWKAPANAHSIRYFCCPSTCEFKTDKEGDGRNGFYIFDFDERFYTVEMFRWDEEFRGFELANKITEEYPTPPLQTSQAKQAGL